jgi:hypothetical protein
MLVSLSLGSGFELSVEMQGSANLVTVFGTLGGPIEGPAQLQTALSLD